MNRKIRYALLVTLMGSPSFSMGWKDELAKTFVPTASLQTVCVDIRSLKVTARIIVFGAFGYSTKNAKHPSPQNQSGQDLEQILRNYPNFENKLETFLEIVKEYDIPVTESTNRSEQWRDLSATLALSDSVYSADRECSNKDIDPDLKQIMAIQCLLAVAPEFLNETHTKLFYDTNAFELAKKLNEKPKPVLECIPSKEDEKSEKKLPYILSEVKDGCSTKKIEEKPALKEAADKIEEKPVELINLKPSKNNDVNL